MIELVFYITKCSRPGEGRLIIIPGGFIASAPKKLRRKFAALPAFWIAAEGDAPLRFDPEDIGPDAPGRQDIPQIPSGSEFVVARWDNDWWYVAVLRRLDLETLKRAVTETVSTRLGTPVAITFENMDFEPITDTSVMLN